MVTDGWTLLLDRRCGSTAVAGGAAPLGRSSVDGAGRREGCRD